MAGLAIAVRAEDYSITTFAGTPVPGGGAAGGADGRPGTFNNPYGVAIDAAKNIYVADTIGNTIRKISPSGQVSTLAGTANQAGANDGTGSAARFNFPVGLAVDSAGNVFVADAKNFTIRKITPTGVVTTFAGAAFQIGSNDGVGAAARFYLPYGLAIDGAGNLYVAEGGNQLIRKIAPDGTVSTLAGGALQPGSANGTGTAARFNNPFGVAVDSGGNVYVADSGNHVIRRVTAAGVVTTYAGSSGSSGFADGTGTSARFNQVRGVAVGSGGELMVADYGNHVLRSVSTSGVVTSLAGSPSVPGNTDSVGGAARFYDLTGVAADGTTVYVADTSNNMIRRGVPASTAGLPTITIQPLGQEVSVGQAVPFKVVVSGGGVTYQWLKNGEAVAGATGSTFTIGSAQAGDIAAYKVRVSGGGGSVDSDQANLSVAPVGSGPIVITARPLSQHVETGQPVSFTVQATGSGLAYQWQKNGANLAGATAATYTIGSAQSGDAATYTVRLTAGGATELLSAKLNVGAASAGVSIVSQPSSLSVNAGQAASFNVVASGTSLSYQWFKNGATVAGATTSVYSIASAQTGDAGSYTVRVAGSGGTVESTPATLTVTPVGPPPGPTTRLSNLSVRTSLAAGQILIVGSVMDGGSREVLVRAVGPSLALFGLGNVMPDPRLDIFNGSTVVAGNDDWPASLASDFASVGAFPLPVGSKDAALKQGINGARTIQAKGTVGGVVLVEAYDLGEGNSPRLVNVSARNLVGTGDNILIAGFNVAGTGTKRLLVRAVGPTLAAFGVTGTLNDPKLEIYTGAGVKVTENDTWDPSLTAVFSAVGAFQLVPGSKDAALLTTLPAGGYTVQVRGADGGTGEALVELYEVP